MVPSVNQHILPSQTAHAYHNFDLIKKIKLDYTDVVVSKWKSRVTGLSVVHIDYEGEQTPTESVDFDLIDPSPNRGWLFCCCNRKSVFLMFGYSFIY